MERKETRSVKRFINLRVSTPIEIKNNLDSILRHSSPSYLTAEKWDVNFKKSCKSTQKPSLYGRPKMINFEQIVQKINEILPADQKISNCGLDETAGLTKKCF
jgi:hypothetical protein